MSIIFRIRLPIASDTTPQWLAGRFHDGFFRVFQSQRAHFVRANPELYFKDLRLSDLPDDAILMLDGITSIDDYTLQAKSLLYRVKSERFGTVHDLDGHEVPHTLWKALDPSSLSCATADPLGYWEEHALLLTEFEIGQTKPATQPTDAHWHPAPPVAPPQYPPPSKPADAAPKRHRYPFEEFLADHAQPAAPSPKYANCAMPSSLLLESLSLQQSLFDKNQAYYPEPVRNDLHRLFREGSSLSSREMHRLRLLLTYGFTPKENKGPVFDLEALGRTLYAPGLVGLKREREALLDLFVQCNKPGTFRNLLLEAPADRGGGLLVRRILEACPNAVSIDCSASGALLVGSASVYDSSSEGHFLSQAYGRDVVILRNLEVPWFTMNQNKDSAMPSLLSFLSTRSWRDNFLGVPIELSSVRVVIAVVNQLSEQMKQRCTALFNQTLPLPVPRYEDRFAILKDRAAHCAPPLLLQDDALHALLTRYAPISISEACHTLDRLALHAPPGRRLDAGDLAELLPPPSLSEDEELVSRYYQNRARISPANRSHTEKQVRTLLAGTATPEELQRARGILAGILDCLPVSRPLPDRRTVRKALDRDLLGMESVKEQVTDWLLSGSKRPGLLLVGPPGTAKTSIGLGLAGALGFDTVVRIDMSHMTTPQLAGTASVYHPTPGLLAEQTQLHHGQPIPFLFDEADKAQPEVLHAILELLDSGFFADNAWGTIEQRRPMLFTANSLGPLPGPLLDRLEVVQMPVYGCGEKCRLLQFLWQRRMPAGTQPLPDGLCRTLVCNWAISGGARDVKFIVYRLGHAYANGWRPDQAGSERTVLRAILGQEAFLPPPPINRAGEAFALAACTDGGGRVTPIHVAEQSDTLPVPCVGLGNSATMQESAMLAKLLAPQAAGCAPRPLTVAMDAGVGRDGPSAALAEFLACYSFYTGRSIGGCAASGELLLHGQVRAVGGIAQKINGAVRASGIIRTLLLPAANRPDVTDDLRRDLDDAGIRLFFVATVEEAVAVVSSLPGHAPKPRRADN